MSHEMHSLKSFREQGVPEPRKGRRTSLGYILFSLFVTLLGIAVMAGLALFYGNRQMLVEGPLEDSKTVQIERGMSTKSIAARLYDEKIISNERIFFLAALVNKKFGGSLKAGEYEFAARDSMRQVLDKISTGVALVHKLTIPEGLTSQQVLARLAAADTLTGDLPQFVPEGSVLPDTYVFNRGMERQALLAKMQKAQTDLLDELWDRRVKGLPIKTRQEALILASIVEKETAVASERARVAAVFHNRLLQNIRLQSDPTIIYGIAGGDGKLDRPIRRSDIDAKTAYNTYQIDGLPPTPIANPGRDAIAAVLNPAGVEDLYFVADGTGGHVFAETLAEHNKNVRAWREIEAEREKTAAANAAATAEAEQDKPQSGAPATVADTDDEVTAPQNQASEADGSAAKTTADQGQTETGAPATETASAATEPNASADEPAAELPLAEATSTGDEPAADAEQDAEPGQVAQTKVPLPRPRPATN